MGRLEKTIENKKNRKTKGITFIFTITLFIFCILSIMIIDYRTGKFMGIYDKSIITKVYISLKGLSFKIR